MVYKLRHGRVIRLKTKLFWGLIVASAFTTGCMGTTALLFQLDKSYNLIGWHTKDMANQPNSGKRSPTLLANATARTKPSDKSKDKQSEVLGGTASLRSASCVGAAPRTGLAASSVPQLRKLAEYEQVCPRGVKTASFFVGTPASAAEADDLADWIAGVLKDFAAKQVSPLVFMEPTTGSGLIDAKQYKNGTYDAALDAFFAALKAKGVTDSMMGTWTPWPEGNIPVWTSTDPALFAANVTKTVQFQKKHFPSSKAAVLLESKSYPSASSWSGGKYTSLLPYVQSIPKGLINSFGLQGFAWPPTAPNEAPQLDPTQFLRIDLAAQAAKSLGIKDIWFNTGVFSKSYVVSKTKPYTLSAQQRQAVLNRIASQAKSLKGQGFKPKVHMFTKDKSGLGEAIDWSFWHDVAPTSDSTKVFTTFVRDLQNASIDLWLYDSTD
jgi:hypothetical protein